eukprot:754691-Hanusia_phi.AAC.1
MGGSSGITKAVTARSNLVPYTPPNLGHPNTVVTDTSSLAHIMTTCCSALPTRLPQLPAEARAPLPS